MDARNVMLKDGRKVVIRAAAPADAERLIASVDEVGAERRFILTEKLAMTVEEESRFVAQWDDVKGRYAVADADGRIVGGSLIARGQNPKNRHTASVGIHVVKAFRGVGLGEALLGVNIEWARAAGVKKVWLEVFSNNVRAIALYRKMGFVEEGRKWRHFIIDGEEVDDVVMALWQDSGPKATTLPNENGMPRVIPKED
ncbi:MAG TPA: GNAT family N-acetyltransferase [Thermoplasmata archaeon]|nr:GNAT family N-acetyltransferase [Thermoplasmata archaeon]